MEVTREKSEAGMKKVVKKQPTVRKGQVWYQRSDRALVVIDKVSRGVVESTRKIDLIVHRRQVEVFLRTHRQSDMSSDGGMDLVNFEPPRPPWVL